MGVPVVSRVGSTHVARVGLTLLQAVGLGELAAETDEAYVKAAQDLIADPARLAAGRRGLRSRVAGSRLCDPLSLIRALQSACRDAFATWVAGSR
jgi:predicted O-linked N-acetylglucosamine transferase (SPINDLY family)